MPARDQSRRPPAPVTFYPRRCFPPLPRRPLAALDDRLLAHIMARLAPRDRPRPRLRPGFGQAVVRRRQPSLRQAARGWSDLLGIWRQCEEPRCRLGRCCGGDPLACLPRYLPLLPHAVRLWFACVGVAAEKNVSFADALVLAEREGEGAACARWQAAVRRALATRIPGRDGVKDL